MKRRCKEDIGEKGRSGTKYGHMVPASAGVVFNYIHRNNYMFIRSAPPRVPDMHQPSPPILLPIPTPVTMIWRSRF